ncbi:MAG: VOC family protein [Candidatus Binatia bacterium]
MGSATCGSISSSRRQRTIRKTSGDYLLDQHQPGQRLGPAQHGLLQETGARRGVSLQAGWDQPRWIRHISIRADDPAQVAEFYEKIFELKEAETYRDDGSICMTDGKVKLLLRPRDKSLYRGLREGLDHIGFKVESLQRVKDDLAAFALSAPEAVDGKLGVGGNGKKNEEDFRRCCLGQHFIADPDGVLVDIAE